MATVDNYKIVVDVQGEERVKGLKNAVGGLGTAIAGIGFGSFIAGAARFADQMFDIASATGLAAGEVNAFALAIKGAGGEFNDAGTLINRFFSNLGEAADDQSSKAADALQRVGIGLKELQTLSEGQLLNKAISQLASMKEGADRTRLGIEIFGKSFGKIDPKVLEEIFKTQDIDKLNAELKKVSDTVGAIEAAFFTLQQATIKVLGELTGQTDGFKLSLADAEKIIKTIGISLGLIFGAKVLTAVASFIKLMKEWNVLTKIQVGLQAALQALQGPKGWAILAGAAAAAGGAIYGLNKLLEDNADLAKDLNTKPAVDQPPKQGGAFAGATGIPEKELEARKQAALAAQATTMQMKLQNEEANKLRQQAIDLIGIESDRANVIKANSDAESQAALKVQELTAKINEERAKGKKANQDVIVELQKQVVETNKQKDSTIALNNAEYARLQLLKEQERAIANQKAQNQILLSDAIAGAEYEIQLRKARGQITQEDAAKELEATKLRLTYETQVKTVTDEINKLKEQGEQADKDRIKNLQDQLVLLGQQFNQDKKNIETKRAGDLAVAQGYEGGMVAALENIAKSFTPVQMAQDAIMIGWSNISRALDTFAETGKFKFSDFAKSVIKDISLMITKMLVFQAIGTALNAIFPGSTTLMKIFGREKGGPVSGNTPYVVGEKGPELFVPKSAGDIIPNNKLGASTEANMTGTGTVNAPVYNTYNNYNISALDSKSVAQMFAENRKILLGTVQMAQRELPT
jgi:hypothetical protein